MIPITWAGKKRIAPRICSVPFVELRGETAWERPERANARKFMLYRETRPDWREEGSRRLVRALALEERGDWKIWCQKRL